MSLGPITIFKRVKPVMNTQPTYEPVGAFETVEDALKDERFDLNYDFIVELKA